MFKEEHIGYPPAPSELSTREIAVLKPFFASQPMTYERIVDKFTLNLRQTGIDEVKSQDPVLALEVLNTEIKDIGVETFLESRRLENILGSTEQEFFGGFLGAVTAALAENYLSISGYLDQRLLITKEDLFRSLSAMPEALGYSLSLNEYGELCIETNTRSRSFSLPGGLVVKAGSPAVIEGYYSYRTYPSISAANRIVYAQDLAFTLRTSPRRDAIIQAVAGLIQVENPKPLVNISKELHSNSVIVKSVPTNREIQEYGFNQTIYIGIDHPRTLAVLMLEAIQDPESIPPNLWEVLAA